MKQKLESTMPSAKIKKAKPVVPSGEVNADGTEKQERHSRSRRGRTLSDMAADNSLHYIDHYWPNALKLYPYDRGMNMCDKFYPQAVGGPLWVDEESNNETRNFEKKKEVMKAQGLRYIVIMRAHKESDIIEMIA